MIASYLTIYFSICNKLSMNAPNKNSNKFKHGPNLKSYIVHIIYCYLQTLLYKYYQWLLYNKKLSRLHTIGIQSTDYGELHRETKNVILFFCLSSCITVSFFHALSTSWTPTAFANWDDPPGDRSRLNHRDRENARKNI